MYEVDDAVLYGMNGVCRVIEIATQSFGAKSSKYYVLKPVYTDSFEIFVPVENEDLTGKMRRVISKEQVMSEIDMFSPGQQCWIEDDAKRLDSFNQTLKNGEHKSLFEMVNMLFRRREELRPQKKKLHASDERFLKDASRLIREEFAYVLEMEQNDVKDFVQDRTGVAI